MPAKAGIQSSAASADAALSCHLLVAWLLDHPLSRMMTAEVGGGTATFPLRASDLAEKIGELFLDLLPQLGARARHHGKVLEPLERPAGVDDGA